VLVVAQSPEGAPITPIVYLLAVLDLYAYLFEYVFLLLLVPCELREDAEPQAARGCENGELLKDWPRAVIQELPAIMAELDPQAELMLNLTCPVCSHAFSVLFDSASFFFQELANRMEYLYQEVHILAFHYHWSEKDIMSMTSMKRQRYLDLLAEALA